MSDNECNLCTRHDIKTGKDTLLHEDNFCYLVKNGNTHIKEGDVLKFAKDRYTFILKEHKSKLTEQEQQEANSILNNFMQNNLKMEPEKDYFLKSTMGTYPQHYHLHAFVLPFTDKGVII